MTATLISTHQPTARGRTRMLALATAVAIVICAALGASTSRADTGQVYFDARFNVAAGGGDFLFNGTFTGNNNVGLGRPVMTNLTNGSFNVATGIGALFSNTRGASNVASGYRALTFNTGGNENVATGIEALYRNTIGNRNSAAGARALFSNTTGDHNTALGNGAGKNLTTGSNNVDIANAGRAEESRTIRIGDNDQTATFIAGISGNTLPGPDQTVVVNANGQLGTATAAAKTSAATPLSAADGERLLDLVDDQQRQIDRLREQVKGG
jgi:hypothetical protein